MFLIVANVENFISQKSHGSEWKREDDDDDIDVENDDTDATLSDDSDHENIDEIPDSQRSTIHKQRPAGNLLKEVRTLKAKYELLDELDVRQCYSVICRRDGRCQCYSSLCLLKTRTKEKLINSVKNYRIVASKPVPFDEVGAHSPVRLTFSDTDSGNKVDAANDSVNKDANTTAASVNGQANTNSATVTETNQNNKSEGTDSSDGRSSRASSEIKIRMDDDIDETSQGSATLENKFLIKNDRTYSSESPCGKVYLKKLPSENKRSRKLQHRVPQLSTYRIGKKTGTNDNRPTSILVLPGWELRLLARKGGRYYPAGFNHNSKANNSVWPYPCSRPVFKTTW